MKNSHTGTPAKPASSAPPNAPSALELQQRLQSVFGPVVEVTDDSHLHVGHAGAGGGGHYSVRIVSDKFMGLRTVQCHRLVYDVVSDWMPHRVHALSINTQVPEKA